MRGRRRPAGRADDAGHWPCALPDTVRLTRHAVAHGCGGVLMLPPFYYKAVSDDGLFASFGSDPAGGRCAPAHLPVSHSAGRAGPGRLALVERLVTAFPGTVAGSRTVPATRTAAGVLERSAPRLRRVFQAARRCCWRHCARGAGCISATRTSIRRRSRSSPAWQAPTPTRGRRRSTACARPSKFPMIPALKAAVAHFSGDACGRPCGRLCRPHRGSAAAAAGDAERSRICDAGSRGLKRNSLAGSPVRVGGQGACHCAPSFAGDGFPAAARSERNSASMTRMLAIASSMP